MTAPAARRAPARRRLRRDEGGVSAVLGAILLFGLLIVTLVRVRVTFVPIWDHDHEADFMDQAHGQMAQVKTDFDRQTANQTSASVADPFRLGRGGGFTFFGTPDQPGTLTFTPGPSGSGFTLASNFFTVQSRDGEDLQGLQGYAALTSGQSAGGLTDVEALKIRLDNPMAAAGSPSLRIDVTSGGTCAAQMIVAIGVPAAPPRNVEIQTYGAYAGACSATPPQAPLHLRDTLIGCLSPCVSPSQFYFDALDPDLQFSAVLTNAATPFTVTFTLSGTTPLQASAIYVYDQNVQGGTNRVGGGGIVTPGYSSTLAVGTLAFDKNNQRFADQSLVVEYGAVVLVQDGVAAMAVPPVFRINTTASQARLDITLPALTGTPNQIGGSQMAEVISTPNGQRGSVDGLAPQVTITLSSAHPTVWTSYWDDLFGTAGFVKGTHFTTQVVSGTAVLTFLGPVLTPNDQTANDIVVHLQTSPLAITLRATG